MSNSTAHFVLCKLTSVASRYYLLHMRCCSAITPILDMWNQAAKGKVKIQINKRHNVGLERLLVRKKLRPLNFSEVADQTLHC